MRNRKSPTKYFLGLYEKLIVEDVARFHGMSSLQRDFQEIENRVFHEGMSFMTKTMPSLAKAFDKALVDGRFTPVREFAHTCNTAYPQFLGSLFKRVFAHDGSVLPEPDIAAVKDIRQILYLVYKYEEAYDENTVSVFLDGFVSVDQSLGWETPALGLQQRQVVDLASTLLCELLRDFDPADIIPAHGPGSVATGENQWEKMNFKRRYACIDAVYPAYKYFYLNSMDLVTQLSKYKSLERLPSGISRVQLVPKDSRGPRLISMEPLEFQWFQQGLSRKLVKHIQSSPSTRGHVNFTDQSINRELARAGSCPGANIVTLDMKEASDRVSLWLVRELFARTSLLRYLEATRTEATELPTGVIHLYRKFAPMGSSMCFPIMSLVHWALSVSVLSVCSGLSVERAQSAVFVYGDDIVIKGEDHMPLITQFPHFMLKFNEGKCCTAGIFRESCGMDAVLGEPVVPLKIRTVVPNNPYDASGYLSYIEYCNTLWNDGYYSASEHIRSLLKLLYKKIPHVSEGSAVPGFYTRVIPPSNKEIFRHRWRKDYMRDEWYVPTVVSTKVCALPLREERFRFLLSRAERYRAEKLECFRSASVDGRVRVSIEPAASDSRVYTIPRRVKMSRGWAPYGSLS